MEKRCSTWSNRIRPRVSRCIWIWFASITALAVVTLLATTLNPRSVKAAGTGYFVVSGNKLLDPNGVQFIIKGATSPYGTFDGGSYTGWGFSAYQNRVQDAQTLKSLGFNLTRVNIAAWNYDPKYNDPNNGGVYKSLTTETVPQMLDDVVSAYTSQGIVVDLGNDASDAPGQTYGALDISWLQYLSTHYKSNPYVWISPQNEPDCNGSASFEYDYSGITTNCQNWAAQQGEENAYIKAIRDGQGPSGGNQGTNAPILINGITWSWDESGYLNGQYPLTDPMFPTSPNIAYGAHRYANDCAYFDNTPNTEFPQGQITDVNNLWGSFSLTHVVYVDEVGNYNFRQKNYGCNSAYGTGSTSNAITWQETVTSGSTTYIGFQPWVANWVKTSGGSGAIGFNWHWNDANNMTGSQKTYSVPANETLDQWGQIFVNDYVKAIP